MGGVEAPGHFAYAVTQIRVFATYLRLVLFPVRQNLNELEPENAAAHLQAGLICALVKKDRQTAVPYLKHALELDPSLPDRDRIEKLLGGPRSLSE
ncbi:MAG: hypothetical protein V1789_11900 [PVC group bacterium]